MKYLLIIILQILLTIVFIIRDIFYHLFIFIWTLKFKIRPIPFRKQLNNEYNNDKTTFKTMYNYIWNKDFIKNTF
jgi:hypothetical protein